MVVIVGCGIVVAVGSRVVVIVGCGIVVVVWDIGMASLVLGLGLVVFTCCRTMEVAIVDAVVADVVVVGSRVVVIV